MVVQPPPRPAMTNPCPQLPSLGLSPSRALHVYLMYPSHSLMHLSCAFHMPLTCLSRVSHAPFMVSSHTLHMPFMFLSHAPHVSLMRPSRALYVSFVFLMCPSSIMCPSHALHMATCPSCVPHVPFTCPSCAPHMPLMCLLCPSLTILRRCPLGLSLHRWDKEGRKGGSGIWGCSADSNLQGPAPCPA